MKRVRIPVHGTPARALLARGVSRHGAGCSCRYCQPEPQKPGYALVTITCDDGSQHQLVPIGEETGDV